jgi:hypothetical protein
MSPSPSLPAYAAGRYTLAEATADGERWLVLHDFRTGAQIIESIPLPVAAGLPLDSLAGYDVLVRSMIRYADTRRAPADPIGEAARAAHAVHKLCSLLTSPAGVLVEPDDYGSVMQHVADVLADLQALTRHGAEMAGSYEDMAEEVAQHGAARQWRSASWRMSNLSRLIEAAMTDARVGARIVAAAAEHGIDCGDCRFGRCHWGGEEAIRRAEAAGRTCGCTRHEVSVALRAALPADEPSSAPVGDGEPAECLECETTGVNCLAHRRPSHAGASDQ